MDWSIYYPAFAEAEQPSLEEDGVPKSVRKIRKEVTIADIGCGFGGLLVALAPKLPDELILGSFPTPLSLPTPIPSSNPSI